MKWIMLPVMLSCHLVGMEGLDSEIAELLKDLQECHLAMQNPSLPQEEREEIINYFLRLKRCPLYTKAKAKLLKPPHPIEFTPPPSPPIET